ncbi:hypothetical protein Tco_0989202 [Tanacetum coccineum]|uniref:Uncharacterized protein n=1 Tax=Tanacetum coccineum TaxID=301880 RepID=A0ABQ5ET02_9ASTR
MSTRRSCASGDKLFLMFLVIWCMVSGSLKGVIMQRRGYNVVPPPYTGNFMPPKIDLSFSGLEEFVNEHIVSEPIIKQPVVKTSKAKASADKPKVVRKNYGAPIIEDWVSDSKEENVSQTKIEKKIAKPSFVKIDFVKLLGKLLNKLRNIGKTLTVQEAIKEIGTI